MKTIYYVKKGRRYVEVAQYDSDLCDSFGHGTHLVECYAGGQSRCYNIDPNHAALIAAGRVARDRMAEAMHRASELRPTKAPITDAQRDAWQRLAEALGQEVCTLQGAGARDIVDAGLDALVKEAHSLMQHPAVREAYEQFQTVCKLVNSTNHS